MKDDDATIVVVPRDHFSDTRESLESLYANTRPGCPLVYVDGGSPPPTAAYLREQAAARGFDLVRYHHYLSPNRARNLGAARARTRYVVFVENDVIVAPGWLAPLVDCADATGAAVVGPLNFENRPLFETVHFAGGEAKIIVTQENGTERHTLVERMHKTNIPPSHAPTDTAEFHCMLVRSDVLRRLGGFDENMLSTRDHIDFCLMLQQAGEKIYLEPRSKVNFLAPAPLRMADVPYFALRWSDLWDLSSVHHLRDKWKLDDDAYLRHRYEIVGWRRREVMMRSGLLRWLVSVRVRNVAERMLRPLERRVNAVITRRHARRHDVPLRLS